MRLSRPGPWPVLILALPLTILSCRSAFDRTSGPLLPAGGGPLLGGAATGAVYTMTNAAAGNEIVAFTRSPDGSFQPLGTFATGGTGTGGAVDPLRSQNSLILDPANRFLFAVDAGSDEVTSFVVHPDGTLTLADRVASGGAEPVSLVFRDGLLFVLDAGDSRIEVFRVGGGGTLDSLGGFRLAPGASGASTIALSADGASLIVTERDANRLERFDVLRDGTLAAPIVTPSSGATPFGVAPVFRDLEIVTEAAGAAPDGAVSVFRVAGGHVTLLAGPGGANDSLEVVTASLNAGGLASCWVVVTPAGTAFVVNSGSDALALVRVLPSGRATLVNATAVQFAAGSAPLDLDFDASGRFLYVLEGGSGKIAVIDVNGGTPRLVTEVVAGAPASGLQGLAAF